MLPKIGRGRTTVEKEKPESILAMEVKDFLIEMVVAWSTAVEKETSASWALNSNMPINKACAYTYAQTCTTYTYIHTNIHTNMYTHIHSCTHTLIHTQSHVYVQQILVCIHCHMHAHKSIRVYKTHTKQL